MLRYSQWFHSKISVGTFLALFQLPGLVTCLKSSICTTYICSTTIPYFRTNDWIDSMINSKIIQSEKHVFLMACLGVSLQKHLRKIENSLMFIIHDHAFQFFFIKACNNASAILKELNFFSEQTLLLQGACFLWVFFWCRAVLLLG